MHDGGCYYRIELRVFLQFDGERERDELRGRFPARL